MDIRISFCCYLRIICALQYLSLGCSKSIPVSFSVQVFFPVGLFGVTTSLFLSFFISIMVSFILSRAIFASWQILPQSQIYTFQQVFCLSLNPWLQSISDLLQWTGQSVWSIFEDGWLIQELLKKISKFLPTLIKYHEFFAI